MDELLDTFEHRMEQELSLNPTQTAHARQILSDLMDTLGPQQPEREMAPNPYPISSIYAAVFERGSQAQLAHDKARMVPSKQECIDICRYLMQYSRNLRQGGQNLSKLLKERA